MIKASEARIITKPSDIQIISGMRAIRWGCAHTSASPLNQTPQEILNYWSKSLGWKNPGYHFLITADGTIYELARIDKISNGVKDYNSNSIHFTTIGGVDGKGNPFDNRTNAQKASQLMIINRLKELFPNIIFKGHRDFSTDLNGNGIIDRWEWIKACPSYDFAEWISSVGFDARITPSKIVYKLNYPLIKNDTVKLIQKALGIKSDGIFGSNTDLAVKSFQKSKGVSVDGVVGPTTAKLLGVKI